MAEEHETNALMPGGRLVHRHRLPVRLWHLTNAVAIVVMLMSGLMIFNAHPMLYWGRYGANSDWSWLQISPGHLRVGGVTLPGLGILGTAPHGRFVAFPGWATIPGRYNLAAARQWHFAFAWVLVAPGLLYLLWAAARGHIARDLAPRAAELRPRHLWHDFRRHARLRFPTGEAAARYNTLQKLAYCGVIFVAIPGAVLTGLTLSPGMDAGWPWLLDLFGGRQSARSIHFLCASALTLFIAVHLAMVVLAGPANELRSIVTGRYRLPADRGDEA